MLNPAFGGARTRSFRVLSATLVAGAIYDLVFAALFVAAPGFVARTFALPLPGPPFYLPLLAVLLAMLAGTYLVTARDPVAYRPLVALAIAGRLLGAVAMAASAARYADLGGLWAPAGGDLAFAAAHALAARGLWRA
jgi:hypothetical protein